MKTPRRRCCEPNIDVFITTLEDRQLERTRLGISICVLLLSGYSVCSIVRGCCNSS